MSRKITNESRAAMDRGTTFALVLFVLLAHYTPLQALGLLLIAFVVGAISLLAYDGEYEDE